METSRLLLISMPFSLAYFPNLALGTLKPIAERVGWECDTEYFSLDHVATLGDDANAVLSDVRYYNAQVGEWVFTGVAHGTPEDLGTTYLTELFAVEFPQFYTPARIAAFLAARAGAAAFIEACYASVDWTRYRMVGFTSSFQQTMASLALARRIKQSHPDILIVFGGANCQGEMGTELHRLYSFLDAVCQGEGDIAFPQLLQRVAKGEDLRGIPGFVVRHNTETVEPADSTISVNDMNSLPVPDFDAFFAKHASLGFQKRHPPAIVFETSRGCWWGAKSHCTFCGLNGVTMSYRAKTQDRAFEELEYLCKRHGTRDVANADNILEMKYFEEFVPRLEASGLNLLIFYETKSNLKAWHWAALGKAGIRKIQAGVESLETGVLKLMRKGVSGIQNVGCLKLCAEAGIYMEWLNLVGFPGETAAQYETVAALIPRLVHLQPPGGFYRARADRFSPFQRDPASFGVTLDPLPAYRYLYPAGEESIRRLAYHFIMRSDGLDQVPIYTAPAEAAYLAWRKHHSESALWVTQNGGNVVVHDERWGFTKRDVVLSDAEGALLNLVWQVTPWRVVRETLGDRFSDAELEQAACSLDAQGFVVREGVTILALPLRQPGFQRAPAWPELREGTIRPFGDTGLMDLGAFDPGVVELSKTGVRQPEPVG